MPTSAWCTHVDIHTPRMDTGMGMDTGMNTGMGMGMDTGMGMGVGIGHRASGTRLCGSGIGACTHSCRSHMPIAHAGVR